MKEESPKSILETAGVAHEIETVVQETRQTDSLKTQYTETDGQESEIQTSRTRATHLRGTEYVASRGKTCDKKRFTFWCREQFIHPFGNPPVDLARMLHTRRQMTTNLVVSDVRLLL